jgi:pyruvate/2-oxoglutarate dehydrogenase complex dihydrolipoamide acyltransferase (E2) component
MIYGLVVPGAVEDVPEVRVLDWHGDVGTVFAAGDLIVELETHKVVIEVRAEKSAVLRTVFTPTGEWQKTGAVIAVLSDTADEALPADTDGLAAPAVAFAIV